MILLLPHGLYPKLIRGFVYLSIFISVIAQGNCEPITFDLESLNSGSFMGRLFQGVVLLGVLSVAPALIMMVTSFTRFVIVFSFLRSAIGTQQSPPNMIMVSLSLFLSAYVMMPTFEEAYDKGVVPLMENKIKEEVALEKITRPFHKFMGRNVREKDLKLFLDLSKTDTPTSIDDVPLRIMVPAFMISELKRGFEIGFLIFLPFVIIDMVIASLLMAMGMMMVSPTLIALPFKIIFFVMVDGWHMLCGSLVKGFL